MRKILFRGKPKSELIDWIYGCYFWSELSGKHYIMGVSKDYGYTNIEVIPETVGQYTGLKDKNGKEIFEGDICKSIYGISRVIWSDGRSAFMMRFCDYPHEIIGFEEIQDSIEIIGNIYDTPELLEAEG